MVYWNRSVIPTTRYIILLGESLVMLFIVRYRHVYTRAKPNSHTHNVNQKIVFCLNLAKTERHMFDRWDGALFSCNHKSACLVFIVRWSLAEVIEVHKYTACMWQCKNRFTSRHGNLFRCLFSLFAIQRPVTIFTVLFWYAKEFRLREIFYRCTHFALGVNITTSISLVVWQN